MNDENLTVGNEQLAAKPKIKIGEKIAFCVGEIFGGGGVVLMDAFFFTYATLIIGIDPAVVGTIGMLARFWDAFTDPLMGTISDNTRTKVGRRRPYILASAGLIIVGLVLLFMPVMNLSNGGKIAYLIFMYLLYSTISTVFNVPYLSLTSEISENVKERSNMNMIRLIVSALAGAVCFVVPDSLIGLMDDGVVNKTQLCFIVSIGFGLFFGIPTLCTGLFTKERTPLPENKSKFSFKNFTNTFKLKSFRRLLGMYVFSFTCNAILSNLLIIYCFNVTAGADIRLLGFRLATLVYIVMLVAAGVMMPIVLIMLNKKVPKPVIYMIGIPMFIAGGIAFAAFPANSNPYLLLLPAAVAGIGFGFVQSIPWLTFPDIVDVAELKSNDRNPGAYNGTMTFFKKFASGIAVFLIGVSLKGAGYDSLLGTNTLQPAAALTGMRLIIGISVPLLLVLGFVCAYLIKITTKKSERIRYFIDKQRAGELDGLNDEDKAEYEKLAKELF